MGTPGGTGIGEFLRSFWQFKTTPYEILAKHWARSASMDTANKWSYRATWFIGSTLLGALALQLTDLTSGKDPRDMTTRKFWLQALLKGGGLGIYGDLVIQPETQYGQTLLEQAAGPIMGDANALYDMIIRDSQRAARGEKTQTGANAVRFGISHLPFQNIWWADAALDQLVFNELQEWVSPGWSARRAANERRFDTSRYIDRQRGIYRAPDMGKAVGERE
jgi:hypothetical protein